MQNLKASDLNRDELLFLVEHRSLLTPSQRDLWRARWEVLMARATAAMKAYHEADRAWSDAVMRLVAPGLSRIEYERRSTEVARLDRIAKRARVASKLADTSADAAYASLDAAE